ncbi:MAG: hypothetical protein FWE38_00540 [Firmicutes bacterium]|nr:hypothetical protein [Bacillota bacterium]
MIGLAFLIISSIIGAGFASGAEILSFFGNSPLSIWLIASLVGLALFALMGVTLYLVNVGFVPPRVVFVPIYFAFFVAMTAGLNSLVGVWGSVIALATCIVIVTRGFERLIKFNTYVIGFVLIVLIVVTVPNIQPTAGGDGGTRVVLYAGLNCLLFPVLSRARKKYSTRDVLIACAMACGVLALFVMLMLGALPRDYAHDMPILGLGGGMYFVVYAAVFLSVFSSQFISLFNIDQSIGIEKAHRVGVLSIICVLAFCASLVGFTYIIDRVYPLIGAFVVIFLCGACVHHLIFRQMLRRQNRLRALR